ncbi:efflux RND transporter periplasmic adaptor subunit [Microvirga sp. VF16]|uniref:efflux RND transporter periplasmic adaptor subunit n=1 Tax=Microvirga sp. VF16 TaxID=2807101 RepID=UPI00193C8798|nr:efflux RND transporter periplasmic adaptor subunit [Microvirga sp. VF16]QRM31577.1 efflux RND transporter periplasmic adaptor subunit [Microvirga sp. VF16]
MIRTALLLLTTLTAGGLWYVLAGAEGQASARASVAKVLGTSSQTSEPPASVQTSLSQKSPPSVAVITAPVRAKAIPITRTSIGWIEPTARVTVRARIDGTIVERHIHDGAEVAAGDLLFRLDDRELQAQIARGEAVLNRDRAVLAKAQAALKRTQELLARSVATHTQAEEAAAEVRIAAANVAASEATLDMDRTRLGHTRITAPISGRAGVVQGSEGHVVRGSDPSGDGLVTITRISPLQVSFSLPEHDLPLLRAALAGSEDKGRVRVFAGRDGQLSAEAELTFIDSSVDVGSGTILVKATLKTYDGLWPGQYVRVELTLGMNPQAAAVPLVALQTGHSGPHVFVVGRGDIVEMRRVQPLDTNHDEAVITEGLTPGERVVVEGQARLRDGSLIVEAALAPAPVSQGSRTADARPVRP